MLWGTNWPHPKVKVMPNDTDLLETLLDWSKNDAVRKQIDIKADAFGFLGGRETYVVDAEGTVIAVHNAQLDVDSHIKVALDAIRTL